MLSSSQRNDNFEQLVQWLASTDYSNAVLVSLHPRCVSANGRNGGNGENGSPGRWFGGSGGDAGPAENGGDAGEIAVTICPSHTGEIIVFGTLTFEGCESSIYERISPQSPAPLWLCAYGGNGGRGGDGGGGADGCSGANGGLGQDGGDGGPGGNGGAASPGGNGGNGGVVTIRFPKGACHLLHYLGVDVSGGWGGAGGWHGGAGSGGSGGWGGPPKTHVYYDHATHANMTGSSPPGRDGGRGDYGLFYGGMAANGRRGEPGNIFFEEYEPAAVDREDACEEDRSRIEEEVGVEDQFKARADKCCRRGDRYFRRGDYETARKYYTRAIKLNPGNAKAYCLRGAATLDSDPDSAMEDLNTAISLGPENGISYYNRALIFQSRECFEDALADLNNAIDLEPELVMSYLVRGQVYFALRRFKRAMRDVARFLDFDLEQTEAYLGRARAVEQREIALQLRARCERRRI